MVTGEESGDVYAGRLIAELTKRIPGLVVEGIGGPRFRAAGGTTFHDIRDMATIGFAGPLFRIGFYLSALKNLKTRLAAGEYDGAVLVDFPDFNLRVAKAADAAGVPTFYYVAPQFWAWRRYRTRAARDRIDLMAVVFPFEEDFYKGRGVNARFFGHPILDELPPIDDREGVRRGFGAGPNELLMGLLPGSRHAEVTRMLPIMLDGLKLIRKEVAVKALIPCADSIDVKEVEQAASRKGVAARVVSGQTWEAMNACDFLIAKSGTTTLQAAIAGTPSIIVYRADSFSYLIAKALSHVAYAGLPNLIAGKEVMPELIQGKATAENIAATTLPYLKNPAKRAAMAEEIATIKQSLGEKGAAGRAADAMVDFLTRLAAARR
jgi:lipid-A-disaccharide synthase